MPEKAGGSLVMSGNKIIGSSLIAQQFKSDAYFWPRPSATLYDPLKPAGGSNLGPTSKKLQEIVRERVKIMGSSVPAELVYASGSGSDPHVSLETAYYQIERVAKARSIDDPAQLRLLIDQLAEGFSSKYVNVLLLNLSIDRHYPVNKP
jgi:K+-transporting ATPase ATPase C chain